MPFSSSFLQFFVFLVTYLAHVFFVFLKYHVVESAHWTSHFSQASGHAS